jgi:hypothetical protein
MDRLPWTRFHKLVMAPGTASILGDLEITLASLAARTLTGPDTLHLSWRTAGVVYLVGVVVGALSSGQLPGPASPTLVRKSGGAVDHLECVAEFVGGWVSGGDGARAGLDPDGLAAGCPDELCINQPAWRYHLQGEPADVRGQRGQVNPVSPYCVLGDNLRCGTTALYGLPACLRHDHAAGPARGDRPCLSDRGVHVTYAKLPGQAGCRRISAGMATEPELNGVIADGDKARALGTLIGRAQAHLLVETPFRVRVQHVQDRNQLRDQAAHVPDCAAASHGSAEQLAACGPQRAPRRSRAPRRELLSGRHRAAAGPGFPPGQPPARAQWPHGSWIAGQGCT